MKEEAPGRKRLLIVDDEKDLIELLAMRFSASGAFEVETTLDGQTALEKARSWRPDVILLDIVMPRLNGWEVCRRLRGDPRTKDIPIVVMTAQSPDTAQSRAHEAGADCVLIKPFSHPELLAVVRSLSAKTREERHGKERKA